jgi:hypothetical protein
MHFFATALIALLGLQALAASPGKSSELRSAELRRLICDDLTVELNDMDKYFYSGELDVDACVEDGQFTITDSVYDQGLKTTTLMKITFSAPLAPFVAAGTASLALKLETDSKGRVSKSWIARDLDYEAADQRSVAEVIEYLFDETEVDTRNGDYGSKMSERTPTVREIEQTLEELLENGSDDENSEDYSTCSYSNTTNPQYTLRDLVEYAPDLGRYLERLFVEGLVEHAVVRSYEDGESEYCSHYYFEIYLKDGLRIWVHRADTT